MAGLAIACSPLKFAETVFIGQQASRTTDIAYGSNSRQRLDVYRPRVARGQSQVVVFLYGGRWQSGSKHLYHLLGDAFTRRGFVVVVPDYRLYPEVKFPGWVNDAAQAVQWTRKNIHRFGGDSTQMWIVGHSSGAHTAALLALDERYLRDAGLPSDGVKGFISIAGPVDTAWTDADVQTLMGPRESWPSTYPGNFIDATEAPLLLLHGTGDKTVSPRNSTRLAERIRARGGCARVILYRGLGHVEIVVALAVPQLGNSRVVNDAVKFIRERGRARKDQRELNWGHATPLRYSGFLHRFSRSVFP